MRGILLALASYLVTAAEGGEWRQLPSLPDAEGFAGCFAGASHGSLVVAGGANFPDRKPWEGGKKVWHDSVFMLERSDGKWKSVGKLLRPLGYGVCVTHRDQVVCVGGSDAHRHYADAFRLEWREGKLVTTSLPSLPMPLANATGALVGDNLYVAGGQTSPEASIALSSVWRIDLSADAPIWKQVESWPGEGRILAVAAGCAGAFWIVGGAALRGDEGKLERRYLRSAYRYAPDDGWKRIADLPFPVAAAPSPAPADASGFFVLGGDDGSQVGVAPQKHRGFGKNVVHFDPKLAVWRVMGELPEPRVTAPCVAWNGCWVIPSGEVRPGFRSPHVWALTLKKNQ